MIYPVASQSDAVYFYDVASSSQADVIDDTSAEDMEELDSFDYASSSDASRPDFYYDELEDLDRDDLLRLIYSRITEICDSLFGPAVDVDASVLNETDSVEVPQEDLGTLDDYEIYDESLNAEPLLLTAQSASDSFINSLRYDVSFGGTDYTVLFPTDYIDCLYVDANNRLWNMSTSTVTGRVVDETFNPIQTTGTLVYLTPCLGNNFSSVNNYGSPNYFRNYYWQSGSLRYTDSYGVITVTKYYQPFYVSHTTDYILIFITLGGVLILWLRSFKNY